MDAPHHCSVPAHSTVNPWVCPICQSRWSIVSRQTAAKSRRDNIRVNGRRPRLFGRP